MFIEYGKTFWSQIRAIAGEFKNQPFAQAGVTAGITPFRAFRRANGGILVLIEPTHTAGAYVHLFASNDEYSTWYNAHMHIDVGQRDL